MSIDVKICGLRTPETVRAAVEGGARAIGLNFHPPSPRFVTTDIAAALTRLLPTGLRAVGVFVDPTDDDLARMTGRVPLDIIQLHGGETPRRVAEIRGRFSIPVMKAIGVATAPDLAVLPDYEAVADWILFDAKPPHAAPVPGGQGIAFDWDLLKNVKPARPWILSGGLTAENLPEAVAATGATVVDVSSGVEESRGVKSVEKIAAFLAAAKRI